MMRCEKCHRPMEGTTAYDGACECSGLIEAKPITLFDLAVHRLGLDAETTVGLKGDDFEKAGLPMFGGCFRCGATVAAYNACPTKTGYIACQGCTDGDGWLSVQEANEALFGVQKST